MLNSISVRGARTGISQAASGSIRWHPVSGIQRHSSIQYDHPGVSEVGGAHPQDGVRNLCGCAEPPKAGLDPQVMGYGIMWGG